MTRLVALLSAVLILLPACGADKADAAERIAAAPEVTTEDGSARVAMTMKMSGGAQDVEMTAEGGVEFATQWMSMTMDMGHVAGQQLGTIDVVGDGTVLYMKMPDAQELGLPTPWMKMDLQELSGAQGLGSMQQLNNDPSSSLHMLRGVSEDVTDVGSEEVRGAQTTHYKATIDIAKALEQAPEPARKHLRQQFETAGITQLPVDVWIDDEGRMRRQAFTMDLSNVEGANAPGAPTRVALQFELFDFGADIDVEPPPAKT